MTGAEVEAKLAEIPVVDYDRIGERMHVELVYVNCGEGADAAAYTALVEKAKVLEELWFWDVQILRSLRLLLKYARTPSRFSMVQMLPTMRQ